MRASPRGLLASAALLVAGALCYPLRAHIPGVVLRGVLPDFLWAGAFACALIALTRSRRLTIIAFVVAEVLELAQLHAKVPGTFDALDLVAIALGFAVAVAFSDYGAGGSSMACSSTRRFLARASGVALVSSKRSAL